MMEAGVGDAVNVRVKDISSGQEVHVALGAWDTIGVLKRRLEGKGMGSFEMQRLVHSGRILGNDETLMAAGVAKAPQVVLSVKRIDTSSTTGVLRARAEARGEQPYVCTNDRPAAATRSWREELEQESASNLNREAPTCRICHSDHNGPGDDRLFSPCLCRGSMRFVHVGCLNRWRALSTNPRSYYQCDSCMYKYNLQRTKFADYCHSYKVHEVLMVATSVFLVLLFGALTSGLKLETYLYKACEWNPPWHTAEYAAYRNACDLIMSGLMVLGGIGFALAARNAYLEDARGLQWNLVYLLAAYGTMVVRLLCFLGLLHSLRALHTRVEEELKSLLSKFGDAILEVRPGAALTAQGAQH